MHGIRRRLIGSMGLALVAPALARAQPKPAVVKTVGILSPNPRGSLEQAAAGAAAFAQRGWTLGKNLAVERPEGRETDLPHMASLLVQKRVDVIWTIGPEAAVAAARATREIPVVFWGTAHPVEAGLVDSLARPGRNLTGVAFFTGPELFSKQLELLKQLAPRALRIAWLSTPSAARGVNGEAVKESYHVVDHAARNLGFELRRFELSKDDDFQAAFGQITSWRAQSIGVPGTALTWRNRVHVVAFANRGRLPSAFNQPEFVEDGGLFSYGPSPRETIPRAIDYIDRVLRGARPAELPVELPAKYEFVVNVKTAKTLGIKVADSLLARVDRVIE